MKLLAWNCQGAFRHKARPVAAYRPDIAVISECEDPAYLRYPDPSHAPASVAWFGDAPHKGLAILSYTGLTFQLYPDYDPSIHYCIPLRVHGLARPLHILAVWAKPHLIRRHSYVGQIHLALERYGPFLAECDSILMGDFNSNTIWDGKYRRANHSTLVARLLDQQRVSLYHHRYREPQGRESRPTLYMYRKPGYTFHIDYCFVPHTWLPRLAHFRLGRHSHYSRYSDHVPLFAHFTD